MRQLFIIFLLALSLSAKTITPSEVYSQVDLIEREVDSLLEFYGLEHKHNDALERKKIKAALKSRNAWHMTYEISIKIDILRTIHNLPFIQPVNIEPVLELHPDLVYEQTQRLLSEIKIFKYRMGIESKEFKSVKYKNKTPLDVFNVLNHISGLFDELNGVGFTPSYVFGETMRIYDDLTTILQHLKIKDYTIPSKRNDKATPSDTFNVSMQILNKIKKIQRSVGIEAVDFSVFAIKNPTPSDVFTMTQMILAELQTIKAYIGLSKYMTPAATIRTGKIPADVDQLMNWNLRKISSIKMLSRK